jgi:DNA-binding response OmpR family regulator
MKVLIADDDRDLCQLLRAVLRSRGHEVIFAFDAAQALNVARTSTPDVIVLDINMPGGTGVGALEKLKINMKTSMIPVLVITASTDEQLSTTMQQIGAAEFMQKPLDMEEFCEALQRITGQPNIPAAAQG